MSAAPNVYGVSRSIWTDVDFAPEPFTEREAWMWLVGAAAWKDCRVRGAGGSVALKRGEFCFAVRFLAEKFQWSKDKTHRFLKALQRRDTIRDTSRDKSQIYSIKNYNRFQIVGVPKRDTERDKDETPTATPARQERDKEETGKQVNNKTEQQEARASAAATVSRETKSLVVVQSLPDWLPLDAWSSYLEMRRRKRAAPTQRAIDILIDRLDRWRRKGHDPTEVLNNSTASNWTGIFEPNDGNHGTSRQRPPTANDTNLAGAAIAIARLGDNDVECGEAEAHSDVGRPLLPFLDAKLHA